MLRRRQFLQGSLGLLGTATLPARTRAQTIIASQPLADDLYLFQGAGQNVIVLRDSDALLLVDGGTVQHAATLLETLANQFEFMPVRLLLNTHTHPEQTGLNALLAREGTEIVAHENAFRMLAGTAPAATPDNALLAAGLPTHTFTRDYTVAVDDETVRCAHLPLAHTDGDMLVHFPQRDILVAGGVLSTNGWPRLDLTTGAWLGGMVGALDTLLALAGPDTWIVPATGLPVHRPVVQKQRERYGALLTHLQDSLARGRALDAVLADMPLTDESDAWPDAERFVRDAYNSVARHLQA